MRSIETWHQRIISGEAKGPGAAGVRGVLRAGSVGYRIAIDQINHRYDRRGGQKLTRPTVSVGNLTAGGTGKTPTVAWLADALRTRGRRPAILSRGHGSRPGELGDELTLLTELLGPDVPVAADPDRVAGAAQMLAQEPATDLFLLDDGFQHRKVARNFDLVLVDVSNPFGYNHLLPRGLLREPQASLRRADAILLTRSDLGDCQAVEHEVRRWADVPVFRSWFRVQAAEAVGRKAVVACGIGNPSAFAANLASSGVLLEEVMAFPDHHAFDVDDAKSIATNRPEHGVVIVTGKDWVKLRSLWPSDVPIVVAGQRLEIQEADNLLDLVSRAASLPNTM